MFVAERSSVLSWSLDQNLRIQILLNTVDVLVLFMWTVPLDVAYWSAIAFTFIYYWKINVELLCVVEKNIIEKLLFFFETSGQQPFIDSTIVQYK
jgi:hypothetical protein